MKKIIGLDINEVFRAYIETFHYFYEKEFNLVKYDKFGERISGYDCDYSSNNLYDMFEFKEKTIKNKLLISDLDIIYSSKPKFEDEEIHLTKEQVLDIFRYEDYLMELYGTCPKMYTNVGLDLNKLVEKYSDQYIFKFIIKDKKITISPTLFFLSTLRPMISEFLFVNKYEDVWNLCDMYITANPDFIGNKPEGKDIIIVNTPYNKNYNVENKIDKLSELLTKEIL